MAEPSFLRATRESYDALTAHHTGLVGTDLSTRPLDRALLGVFAEWIRATGNTAVADVGCGPGGVTNALREMGLEPVGVDLSPGMVALARRTYPELRFRVGSMLALDIADASLGGLLAHYSIIHLPWEHRPLAFAEFRRVLAPGGQLMLSFQVGDHRKRYDRVDEVAISLDFYRQQPAELADLLREAGFDVRVTAVREPESDREITPQGHLLAGTSTVVSSAAGAGGSGCGR